MVKSFNLAAVFFLIIAAASLYFLDDPSGAFNSSITGLFGCLIIANQWAIYNKSKSLT